MRLRRPSSSTRIAVVVAILPMVTVSLLASASAVANERGDDAHFDRPEATAIRAEARSILSDPRYAPRRSITQWLLEKLSDWKPPDMQWLGELSPIVLWVVVIWCVLALLAILAHTIWTFATMFRGARRSSDLDVSLAGGRGRGALSYRELHGLMVSLAERGAFREAIGVMMVALVRWLENAGVLRFHHSKTNGDYVREYPSHLRSREDFSQFVAAFDSLIYSGASCGREVFRRMNAMFERTIDHARERSKV